MAMLETALVLGVTAVYAGQPRYSLRVRNNDFGNIEVLQQSINTAHAKGAKFFLGSNIFSHGNKVSSDIDPALPGQLECLASRGYTSGFFQGYTPEATQNYLRVYSESRCSLYVGAFVARYVHAPEAQPETSMA